MSQKRQNGNILSFFKPAPKPQGPAVRASQTPLTPRKLQRSDSNPPSPSPLPPSSPPSQLHTPAKSRPVPTRDLEIRASDDEDDGFGSSSDDSLEDLSAILGRGRPGQANPSPAKNLFATPRTKRTAIAHSSTSPVKVAPKHKFDLKALAKDARRDDATNASSMRAKALGKQNDDDEEMANTENQPNNTLEGIVKTEDGRDARKLIRAVQRSEEGHLHSRFLFFDTEYTAPRPTSPPKRMKGVWKLVTQGDEVTRERNLVSGLPATYVKKADLPDQLFDWMLSELSSQKSYSMRKEYVQILSRCPKQIETMITPRRMEELFLRFGASPDLKERSAELALPKVATDPYQDRDWSCFTSFLMLLKNMAPHLPLLSAMYASQALLRMAMDKFLLCNGSIFVLFQETVQALLRAIPRPHWDTFCCETCALLSTLIKPQCLRVGVLACMPLQYRECYDMRRRLAITFLFGDPALSRSPPDSVMSVRRVIERMEGDDFEVGPQTDFAELQACILLVNIVIDDGAFTPTDDLEDERQFNKDIDELTTILQESWKKINDSGMKLARTEAKTTINWVQQRLAYSVRTRKKTKKSIFESAGTAEDPSLPKQQEYMKNFLRPKESNQNGEGTSV